jgi:hypothetical protein
VKRIFFLFLFVFIIACAPAQPIPKEAQATALAYVQTAIARTQTAQPTKTSLPTGTPTFVPVTPSPFPTQSPVILITPDAIQVERWREYQTELAKVIYFSDGEIRSDSTSTYMGALCEWDILGQSGPKIYVWAVCALPIRIGHSRPVIISLESDGIIQSAGLPPENGVNFFDLKMFPPEIKERLCNYTLLDPSEVHCPYNPSRSFPRQDVLLEHLRYRITQPDELPLVVLSAIATPTLIPTP